MATNPFFQNYSYTNEQSLIDSLVVEVIKMFGVDTFYVSRTINSVDQTFNEDDTSVFTAAYETEMYVKSVDGFQGEGDFLSKFGLQIRDQITFSVAIRAFEQNVTRFASTINRPKEGDLIFFPMNNKFFEITFVEHESVFYQAGSLQVYDLKCELFEYSNERFQTGIPSIDTFYSSIQTDQVNTLEELSDIDPIARNLNYEEISLNILDFSEINPFEENITNPGNYKP